MSEEPKNYDVGFKKPPKHTQFKPGQSGNPLGRPKKKRTVADIMQKLLQEEIIVNGEKKSTKELFLRSIMKNAIKGNATATKLLLSLINDDTEIEDFTPELDDKIAMMKVQRSLEALQRKEEGESDS